MKLLLSLFAVVLVGTHQIHAATTPAPVKHYQTTSKIHTTSVHPKTTALPKVIAPAYRPQPPTEKPKHELPKPLVPVVPKPIVKPAPAPSKGYRPDVGTVEPVKTRLLRSVNYYLDPPYRYERSFGALSR